MKIEKMVLDLPIWAEAEKRDEGWDIGLFGGCTTHVGAVSLADPDGNAETLQRPFHKDGIVSAKWATELSKLLKAPTCVRCGIHYDNVSKEQLAVITAGCDQILLEIKEALEQERKMEYGNTHFE